MSIKAILFVNNSKTEQLYMSDILTKAGYAVALASNADAAHARLREGAPDLIMTGVVLRGQDGFQLTRSIKRDEGYKHIPVFMYTAMSREDGLERAQRAGAADYISSSVDPAELLSKIEAIG